MSQRYPDRDLVGRKPSPPCNVCGMPAEAPLREPREGVRQGPCAYCGLPAAWADGESLPAHPACEREAEYRADAEREAAGSAQSPEPAP